MQSWLISGCYTIPDARNYLGMDSGRNNTRCDALEVSRTHVWRVRGLGVDVWGGIYGRKNFRDELKGFYADDSK